MRQGANEVQPTEPFKPNREGGAHGRLRTDLSTDTVTAAVSLDDTPVGGAAFEIRSRKIDYLTHYRTMLRDLGVWLTELIR